MWPQPKFDIRPATTLTFIAGEPMAVDQRIVNDFRITASAGENRVEARRRAIGVTDRMRWAAAAQANTAS